MQVISTTGADGARTDRATWQGDLLLAVAAALGSLLLDLFNGVDKLLDSGGDSDSLMRLVEVRDLLGGQGWFDLMQYRMGLAGGFEMHWSRLVDAPIAALIWLAEMATGDAAHAESIAAWLWPGMLLAACLFLLVRAARTFSGGGAALPAAILGLGALHYMGIFAPGSFDHHNVQLALILAAVALLLGKPGFRASLAAGAAGSLSLAVGMETAPLVAALGAAVALAFLFRGEVERRVAAGYGIGFAGGALAESLATLPPSRWLTVACDAWSGAQAGTAILAGAGLALVAATPLLSITMRRRVIALSVLAAALAVFGATAFPTCFPDPYAGLDPLLRRYWLDWVTEAQGALSFIVNSPGEAAGYFITPLIAVTVIGLMAMEEPRRRDTLVIGLVLAAAFAVSLWQVRGAVFAVPLAIVPLAGLVARARVASSANPGLAPAIVLAVAWLVSFNLAWNVGVDRIAGMLGDGRMTAAQASASGGSCYHADDYAQLAGLPPSTVLSISNLGTSILYNTRHRALSGPYHRNVGGNLAALRALTSEPEAAREAIVRSGADIVAHCPGNDESAVLAVNFPESLIADFARGNAPDWLVPVEAPEDAAVRLFRVATR